MASKQVPETIRPGQGDGHLLLLSSLPRPARAVVIGATGGLGAALAAKLATAGFEAVHAFSRRGLGGPGLTPGALDILDESAMAGAAAKLRSGAPLRLVIVATGFLHDEAAQPEKNMRALESAQLARSFALNTIGPALLAKHLLPLLPREGKSVFAVLSARVGSIEDNRAGGWYGYRASKAALNQIVRTLAIEARRTHPGAVIVSLHPGTVATSLSGPFQGQVKPGQLFTPEQSAGYLVATVDGLTAEETGGFFAWDGQKIPF